MAAKFASTDREAFRRVNDAAHDARRITGRDHPEAELIHQIMLLTDTLMDRTAPAYQIGGKNGDTA